jgi:prenyltransferase beta subunit
MSPSVTPAIAARAMLLACLGQAPAKADAARLMAVQCRSGGFMAARLAPVPDLLSTATALCALVAMGAPLEPLRDSCTSFVESLWTDSGGFGGHPADGTADCEYTYYALLSLGTLAGA